MTDEILKKIEKASLDQSLKETEYYGEDLRSRDFEDGVKWFVKNLWHPLSDIPENGKLVIIKSKNLSDGSIFFTQTRVTISWERTLEKFINFRVVEWFYVEDLL